MAYLETTCPNCSLPTVFDDRRIQCHCINCGYTISRDSLGGDCSEAAVEPDRPDVDIMLHMPMKTAGFIIFIDGEEVLRTTGGDVPIAVTPGMHELSIRHDLLSEKVTAEFREGTSVTVRVGFMGMRISVS